MDELNYNDLSNEIIEKLESTNVIVFATCADNKVTARTMCPINDGLAVFFGTSRKSKKAENAQ